MLNYNIKINENAKIALSILKENGHEAFIAGGCVRDCLLNKIPHDFDITTKALPNETLEIFVSKGFRVIETGLKHGTVTVIINKEQIEITTFRTDGDYKDGRHPESVSFTKNIEEDLKRRDFTINAMAYNEEKGIVDISGGMFDLEKGIIRCVGNPYDRFNEDALRILRALRFSSTYGFLIDEETKKAAIDLKSNIKFLSSERILVELKKLLLGKDAFRVLNEYKEIIFEVIPELKKCDGFDQKNYHHIYDVYTHIIHSVENSPLDEEIRMAALLHDIGKPKTFSIDSNGVGHFYGHSEASLEIAEKVLTRLKVDNKFKKNVLLLIKYHDPVIAPSKKIVRRWMTKLDSDGSGILLKKLLLLKRADNLSQDPSVFERVKVYDEIGILIDEILNEESCLTLKSLKISGDDLINLGISQGKTIGIILNKLLKLVMNEEIENNYDALKEKALLIYKNLNNK